MSTFIQYGAGLCGPVGWKNYDSSPMLRLQRIPLLNLLPLAKQGAPYPKTVVYGDVVKGLPVLSNSADLVYCSHTLEHLTPEDCRVALRETFRETFRILKPGGVFRAVMPDLRYLCSAYLARNASDPEGAAAFLRASNLGIERRARGMARLRGFFSRDAHLWMWDYAAIRFELKQVGFVGIRKAAYGDSSHVAFADVESLHRWENCLGFEATKA
jgi:predicted SAM-dependent methyltransferase